MNGIKMHGVSLFLGKIPYRKQECFYFEEDGVRVYIAAYISEKNLAEAKRLWAKFIGESEEENIKSMTATSGQYHQERPWTKKQGTRTETGHGLCTGTNTGD